MEPIESRRYFRCGHCGNYHFPEAVEADGIRVSSVISPTRPIVLSARRQWRTRCWTTMMRSTSARSLEVFSCPARRLPALWTNAVRGPSRHRRNRCLSTSRQLQRTLSCPRCAGRLETYAHSGPGNVVIDNCPKSDMIWLDFGEMRQIVDAPGKDRGSPHTAPVDDNYICLGPYRSHDDDDDGDPRSPRRADPLSFLTNLIFGD